MNSLVGTPRRWAISLAVGLLAALLLALALPADLPQARTLTAQELAWALPTPASVEADKALSIIQQRRLWNPGAGLAGAPGGLPGQAPEEKPLTPPDWRIAGVVSEAGQLVVLIATQGEFQPRTLRVGDTLPGGAKVTAIHTDRVVAKLDGRLVSLSTFPQ